jgi:tetratricopeptide (TPR) repeat protein
VPATNGKGKPSYRVRFEKLHQEALAELNEALAIFETHGNHDGLGSVRLNYGYLHLDKGDLEDAEKEAETAFHLGEARRDHILMARSRLLRCMIENARVDEGIGESIEPGSHARLAQDFAQEAVELAKHTENRRLLAYAHIWQGLTYSNRYFNDLV